MKRKVNKLKEVPISRIPLKKQEKILKTQRLALRTILDYEKDLSRYALIKREIKRVNNRISNVKQLKREKRYKSIRKAILFLLVALSGLLVHFNYKAKYKLDDVDVTNEC
ncbi:hypothetical protein [Staphylococcus capitis]|uniref:hypothetical protein n=1 Tax=Staphylococcus capitis TaxID=29388 RepID=UPI00145B190D|nr:hypothetical protein [Staphylococcus capitis]NMK90601.1 hypothetical protein [Staphylococcus capitis]NMK92060.1 hypothetical protein [Staphylococcus capitis]